MEIHTLLSRCPLSPPCTPASCTGRAWGRLQSFLDAFLEITLQNSYRSFSSKQSLEAGEFLFSSLKWYLEKSCSVSCFILQSPKFAQTALTKQLWEWESHLSFIGLAIASEILLFLRKLLLTSPYFILQNGASLGWNKISNCCLTAQPPRARRGLWKANIFCCAVLKEISKKPLPSVLLFLSLKVLLSVSKGYGDEHSQNKPGKEKLTLKYEFKLLNWPVRGVKQTSKQTENSHNLLTYRMTAQKKCDKTGTYKYHHEIKWGKNPETNLRTELEYNVPIVLMLLQCNGQVA